MQEWALFGLGAGGEGEDLREFGRFAEIEYEVFTEKFMGGGVCGKLLSGRIEV